MFTFSNMKRICTAIFDSIDESLKHNLGFEINFRKLKLYTSMINFYEVKN